MKTDPMGREVIEVGGVMSESLVSHKTGHPRVNVVLEQVGKNQVFQLDVDEARSIAQQLLEAAEAAEVDAFLFHFGSKDLQLSPEASASLISRFRDFRTERNSRG